MLIKINKSVHLTRVYIIIYSTSKRIAFFLTEKSYSIIAIDWLLKLGCFMSYQKSVSHLTIFFFFKLKILLLGHTEQEPLLFWGRVRSFSSTQKFTSIQTLFLWIPPIWIVPREMTILVWILTCVLMSQGKGFL